MMLTYSRGMQDCFRLHPEMYGEELDDEEDDIEDELRARQEAAVNGEEFEEPKSEAPTPTTIQETPKKPLATESKPEKKNTPVEANKSTDTAEEVVPKAAHDATAN